MLRFNMINNTKALILQVLNTIISTATFYHLIIALSKCFASF